MGLLVGEGGLVVCGLPVDSVLVAGDSDPLVVVGGQVGLAVSIGVGVDGRVGNAA